MESNNACRARRTERGGDGCEPPLLPRRRGRTRHVALGPEPRGRRAGAAAAGAALQPHHPQRFAVGGGRTVPGARAAGVARNLRRHGAGQRAPRHAQRDAAHQHVGRRRRAGAEARRAQVPGALSRHAGRDRHRAAAGRYRRRRLRCRHPACRSGAARHDRDTMRAGPALRRGRLAALFQAAQEARHPRRPRRAQLHPASLQHRSLVPLGVRETGRRAGDRRQRLPHLDQPHAADRGGIGRPRPRLCQ